MKRKTVILVSILFILSSLIGITYAEESEKINYSEEYLDYLKLSDEEKSESNVVPRKYFVSFDDVFNKKETTLEGVEEENTHNDSVNSTKVVKANSLPSKYDLSKSITISIEDQGKSSWCTAFASIKSLETFCALNGKGEYNFAEYHLAYMRMKQFGGWTNFSTKDGLTLGQTVVSRGLSFHDFAKYCGFYDYSNTYGSASMYYLMGPIEGENSENKAYEIDETNKQIFTSKKPALKVTEIVSYPGISKTYDSSGYVKEMKNGNDALTSAQIKQERDTIKQHIIEKGSLVAVTKIDANYFNSATNSLYINDSSVRLNHAISIIGWDDNYSKDNFKEGKRPAHDGAYIAQNSWGSNWGDSGKYYISYDDALVELETDGIVAVKDYDTYPNITINKADYSKENRNTKVYLTSDEPLYSLPSGWSVYKREATSKKTIYVKTYKENKTESFSVRCLQGDREKSTQVSFTVDNIPEFKLDKMEYRFNNSDPLTLKVTSSNCKIANVTWKSSNTSVAKVNSEGIVVPIANGKCKIIANAEVMEGQANGAQISTMCDVEVKRATEVVLNKETHTFKDGSELQLTATIMPTGLVNSGVTWKSSDESIAKVTDDGKVIPGLINGSCTVTATTTDGTNKEATCKIFVQRAVYMGLSKLDYTFYSEEPLKLQIIVVPADTSKDVIWNSSDINIATVDEDGNVTPKHAGQCTIYATHKDRGYNIACKITVDKSFKKYLKGDITNDEKVDMEDVYTAIKKLAKGTFSDDEKEIVDVTGDGKVDMQDIYKMLKYISGKVTTL